MNKKTIGILSAVVIIALIAVSVSGGITGNAIFSKRVNSVGCSADNMCETNNLGVGSGWEIWSTDSSHPYYNDQLTFVDSHNNDFLQVTSSPNLAGNLELLFGGYDGGRYSFRSKAFSITTMGSFGPVLNLKRELSDSDMLWDIDLNEDANGREYLSIKENQKTVPSIIFYENGDVKIPNLAGQRTGYLCVDIDGTLYRSTIARPCA